MEELVIWGLRTSYKGSFSWDNYYTCALKVVLSLKLLRINSVTPDNWKYSPSPTHACTQFFAWPACMQWTKLMVPRCPMIEQSVHHEVPYLWLQLLDQLAVCITQWHHKNAVGLHVHTIIQFHLIDARRVGCGVLLFILDLTNKEHVHVCLAKDVQKMYIAGIHIPLWDP